jgi:hypothetical protein
MAYKWLTTAVLGGEEHQHDSGSSKANQSHGSSLQSITFNTTQLPLLQSQYILKELLTGFWIMAKYTKHGGGDRFCTRFLDTTHDHTHMPVRNG